MAVKTLCRAFWTLGERMSHGIPSIRPLTLSIIRSAGENASGAGFSTASWGAPRSHSSGGVQTLAFIALISASGAMCFKYRSVVAKDECPS